MKQIKILLTVVLSLWCLSAQALTYEELRDHLRADGVGQIIQTNITQNIDQTQTVHVLFPVEWGQWPKYVGMGLAALFGIIVVASISFTVSTQDVAIVERFSKFRKLAFAGLHVKVPFIDHVVDHMSLRLEQHAVQFGSITKDKVSVIVEAVIQYKVRKGKEYDAYYTLDDPQDQIQVFFSDIMRAQVPVMTLDGLFEVKQTLSDSATSELQKDMEPFGYEVARVLITAIHPDANVVAKMNDINAAQREQEAAKARGEAQKTLQVKAAEAQAESDKLRGKGIADQRLEIAKGLKASVDEMKTAVGDKVDEREILVMLMMTQQMEMLEKVSANSKSHVLMLPHSPAGANDIRQQIMEAMATGGGFTEDARLKALGVKQYESPNA